MSNWNTSFLTIDLNAVRKNLQTLTTKTKNVMPMVKANAYGTHALTMAKFFQSCHVPIIGVSHTNEAVFLRKEGITHPLFVLKAALFEADLIAKHNLEVAVSSFEEADVFAKAAEKYNCQIAVHLHVNTGMNRFGIDCARVQALAQHIRNHSSLHLEGVMTHFVAAETAKFDAYSKKQILKFQQALKKIEPLPRWIHAANSAGALRFDLPFCNLSRVGLALFGLGGASLDPALSLESYLTAITEAKKGESVGYDRNFKIKKEYLRIGVIPLGYHDGLHRAYSNKGYVLTHGKKAPMIGNICMDFMMVDVTDIPEAKIGDPVTFFNADLTPEAVAYFAKKNVRELLSCLGPRVKRIFIDKIQLQRDSYETEARIPSSFFSLEKNTHSPEHFSPP